MALAIILAISMPFLLLEITYFLTPSEALQQPPAPLPGSKPEPLLSQIIWITQWIGLAAVIAIAFAGAFLLVNRYKKRQKRS